MSRNSKKLKPQKNPEYVEKNQDKEEVETQPPLSPPQPKPTDNPFGLSFVVPTENVSLPSAGLYYHKSSPMYGVESLEIKHMTAKEEDILSSITKDDDSAFNKLIDSLIVDKKYNSSMILEEDKIAILLSARITGYGEQYTTTTLCPNCNTRSEHVFDLRKSSTVHPKEMKYDAEKNCFTCELPNSKIQLELINYSMKDMEELELEKKQKQKYNLEYNHTVSFIRKVIISANGVTDPQMLNQLSTVLPASDAKYLTKFFNSCRPEVSTAQNTECGNCGHQSEREVPLSWAFFRSDV